MREYFTGWRTATETPLSQTSSPRTKTEGYTSSGSTRLEKDALNAGGERHAARASSAKHEYGWYEEQAGRSSRHSEDTKKHDTAHSGAPSVRSRPVTQSSERPNANHRSEKSGALTSRKPSLLSKHPASNRLEPSMEMTTSGSGSRTASSDESKFTSHSRSPVSPGSAEDSRSVVSRSKQSTSTKKTSGHSDSSFQSKQPAGENTEPSWQLSPHYTDLETKSRAAQLIETFTVEIQKASDQITRSEYQIHRKHQYPVHDF
ncbi:hypothetical protein LTR37_017712 [Vermiconidia calcicola]|uniref:Uncharacterized protein n=1 Tax=Vermiconidia calcicola TaxID=1690605 RepID=A0ACC3MKS6_9PEZI|nr:hypothetical protein LTR37_017712 [Vermiconidia calcicola]